ncbi:MAG: ATPase, T2SS/T4P/T4SS family [Alphaproteobacteria bacterium]|nr:ATPase, T2SS/T4P/T4SS family [Alphaproteobacteria bacterium]
MPMPDMKSFFDRFKKPFDIDSNGKPMPDSSALASVDMNLATDEPAIAVDLPPPSSVEDIDWDREPLTTSPEYVAILTGGDNVNESMRVPIDLPIVGVRTQAQNALVLYVPEAPKRLVVRIRNLLADAQYKVELQPVTTEVMELIKRHQARVAARTTESLTEAAQQFASWVRIAMRQDAIDMHLECRAEGQGSVLMRVHGELEPIVTGIMADTVLTSIKAAYETLAADKTNSDGTFTDSKSVNCMIDSKLGIPGLQLRFTTQRGLFGPKASIRLLRTSVDSPIMDYAEMGFSPSQVSLLDRAARLESGLILFCGVTGSGKTTVERRFMAFHPLVGQGALYQVADPIEYAISGVHQIPVQRDITQAAGGHIKDEYTSTIESLLRMDPDLISIGEVRDTISARAAASVAKSGHVVMGTLHADGLSGVINRLTDPHLGLSREELTTSSMLALLQYQALVAVLCSYCKIPLSKYAINPNEPDDRHLQNMVDALRNPIDIPIDNLHVRNHNGCKYCNHRGQSGLTIVSEMMIPDDHFLGLSQKGQDREAWHDYRLRYSDRDLTSGNQDGKTVAEHAIHKIFTGQLDPRVLSRFLRDAHRYQHLEVRQ